MGYRRIDDYYRQEHFDFFRRSQSPFYAVTFHLEVGPLRDFLRERGYPIYLNLCYLFTKAMQPIEDFRYRLVDGEILLFDTVHPGLTVPAPGELFSFVYFDYHPRIEDFNERGIPILVEGGTRVSLETKTQRNYVFYSALPGVSFTGLTHTFDDPTQTEPRVTFGKFFDDGGRLMVPIGMQVSHLFIDGAMLGRLVERATAIFAEPQRFAETDPVDSGEEEEL